jgi:hypothetical protein
MVKILVNLHKHSRTTLQERAWSWNIRCTLYFFFSYILQPFLGYVQTPGPIQLSVILSFIFSSNIRPRMYWCIFKRRLKETKGCRAQPDASLTRIVRLRWTTNARAGDAGHERPNQPPDKKKSRPTKVTHSRCCRSTTLTLGHPAILRPHHIYILCVCLSSLAGRNVVKNNSQHQQQYCRITRLTTKGSERNVFVNVTNLKGQTVVKFTTALGRTAFATGRQQPKRSVIRWIIDRVGSAIGGHYDYTKVIVQARSSESLLYLKESLRKYWHRRPKIIYYKGHIPIAHNGCRPPKKRRV